MPLCTCSWDPPGSFVNDAWTISMKSVTLGNFTHIDMSGKFYTEPENVVRSCGSRMQLRHQLTLPVAA